MDDEDENEDYGHEFLPEGEEEEKLGNDDIQNEHFGPPEEVIQEQEEQVNLMVRNIVEELDEIIDIDKEQRELNDMFIDEDTDL